jgi:hypothetical protein
MEAPEMVGSKFRHGYEAINWAPNLAKMIVQIKYSMSRWKMLPKLLGVLLLTDHASLR